MSGEILDHISDKHLVKKDFDAGWQLWLTHRTENRLI